MPRKRNPVPSLLRHPAKKLGYARIGNQFTYFGQWPDGVEQPPADVWEAYQGFVAAYLAGGGRHAPPKPNANADATTGDVPATITVAELVARWVAWAETYYVHEDGTPTGELDNCKLAFRPLVYLYGKHAARDVGPVKLKGVRELMITGYTHPRYGEQRPLARSLINGRVQRIARVWRWGVAEELLPAEVFQALKALPGLPKGRSVARETEDVKPVPVADVEKTLPHLQPSARAMVQVQLLTGMRPGEVCRLRLDELDRSGDVWLYRPRQHKTKHKGKARVVAVGPKARTVINEYLAGRDVPEDKPMFSPARDRAERLDALRAKRKTKVQPSQASRKKADPKRALRDRWDRRGYQQAVKRAVAAAGVPHWYVGQLRHSHATAVRAALGLEAAQAALGHARADTTQIYAERNLSLAIRVAETMG